MLGSVGGTTNYFFPSTSYPMPSRPPRPPKRLETVGKFSGILLRGEALGFGQNFRVVFRNSRDVTRSEHVDRIESMLCSINRSTRKRIFKKYPDVPKKI